jgi:NodT family efflux transporter outer membrane factor (OMF) lipoprotein
MIALFTFLIKLFFSSRVARLSASTLLLMSLCACSNFSDILPQAKKFESHELIAGAPSDVDATIKPLSPLEGDGSWWLAYENPQLNFLVETALRQQPSLRIVLARVRKSEALMGGAQAAQYPQSALELDITHQRYTANGAISSPLAGDRRESGVLQATGTWELDLFGKNRALFEATVGQLRAAQADAQAARLLLVCSVVRNYLQLLRIEARIGVERRALEQRTHSLRLVQDRVNAGLDSRLELLQSQSGLPEIRLQLEMLQEQKKLSLHAIATLTGQAIHALTLDLSEQSAIKTLVLPKEIPLDLLGRRADVVAARWRIEATMQEVDAIKAQFYPNINLMAFVGMSSIGLDRLLQTGSEQWGGGPAIRLPLFDGGRLRAQLQSKTTDLDIAIESYNMLVLESVREVADHLASVQSIARQQHEQADAQASSEAAYEIALRRYQVGVGNYLQVLAAETAVLTQRRQNVDLTARAQDTQVQLLRTLGGGYKTTTLLQSPTAP